MKYRIVIAVVVLVMASGVIILSGCGLGGGPGAEVAAVGSVRGKVMVSSKGAGSRADVPLAGATVVVVDLRTGAAVSGTTTTGSDGSYFIGNVRTGRNREVKATRAAPGGGTYTVKGLVDVKANATSTKDLNAVTTIAAVAAEIKVREQGGSVTIVDPSYLEAEAAKQPTPDLTKEDEIRAAADAVVDAVYASVNYTGLSYFPLAVCNQWELHGTEKKVEHFTYNPGTWEYTEHGSYQDMERTTESIVTLHVTGTDTTLIPGVTLFVLQATEDLRHERKWKDEKNPSWTVTIDDPPARTGPPIYVTQPSASEIWIYATKDESGHTHILNPPAKLVISPVAFGLQTSEMVLMGIIPKAKSPRRGNTVTTYNITAAASDTITVHAGTFDCVRLELTFEDQENSAHSVSTWAKLWFGKGIGPVKAAMHSKESHTDPWGTTNREVDFGTELWSYHVP